ncbi:MAG: glycosyltransferase family 2 protein [Chitinophagaceae bacterium]|nr:glycosyltransferase family 2 protein [Chitinophagaceae bacterium]
MTTGSKSISVIICTFNPIDEVFKRCLDSVRVASSGYNPAEIIIVDNNSTDPVSARNYVAGFLDNLAQSKVIVERQQGLTHARLRGIHESMGELLIFIDDDNLIDGNYFSKAAEISQNHSFIGAYSGRVTLEYDTEPASWTKRYWGMLIYRDLQSDVWSNLHFNNETMPNGAGLCITRDVASHYVKLFDEGNRNFVLDRSKGSLLSGGDNDLAMCACDIGKGMGLFKDLHLRHYTPAKRFSLEYLSRLAYGIYFSYAVLLYMRTGRIDKDTFRQRVKHYLQVSLMKRKEDRIIQRSCRNGLKDAAKIIESGNWNR